MSDILETKSTLTDSEVTTHTASMWKYTPIIDDFERYSEFSELFEQYQDQTVTAARVRGKKHKHDGTNCDDWFEVAEIGGWVISAVADGAGSKKFSRIGSKVACQSFVNEVKNGFLNVGQQEDIMSNLSLPTNDNRFISACQTITAIMQEAFLHATDAVENVFNHHLETIENEDDKPTKLNDFACTLLTTAVIPIGYNDQLTITIQAGDGMVCAINPKEEYFKALTLLANADSGEFSGETDFITSSKIRNISAIQSRTRIKRSPPAAVLLMTDGVADDYFPNSPNLLNLYLDLILNQIIEGNSVDNRADYLAEWDDFSLPTPELHSWVNDHDVNYYISYAEKVSQKAGVDISDIWDNKFHLPSLEFDEKAGSLLLGSTPAEKLKTWLDVYLKRGSFDDRTLVIIHPNYNKNEFKEVV